MLLLAARSHRAPVFVAPFKIALALISGSRPAVLSRRHDRLFEHGAVAID
jgi:hypothetical protein